MKNRTVCSTHRALAMLNSRRKWYERKQKTHYAVRCHDVSIASAHLEWLAEEKNPTPTRRLTWAASRKKKSNADAKPTTPNLKRNTKKVNNAMRSQTLSRWRARKKNTSILNNPLSRSNMYALSKEMQYTLRCRDVKIRVGALETNRLQEND